MRRLSILASAAALMLALPAAAQAPAPDAARMAAAAALVQQLGIRTELQRQMTASVAQMRSGAVIRAMLAQQPGFVPAYEANRAKFDPVLAKAGAIQAGIAQGVINRNFDKVIAAATAAYARQFTAAELNGLTAFYRGPLGQALQKKQPLVAGEIAQASARMIGAQIDAAMQANQAQLRAALAPLNQNAK